VTYISHKDEVAVDEVVGLVQLLPTTDLHRLLMSAPLVLLNELFLQTHYIVTRFDRH